MINHIQRRLGKLLRLTDITHFDIVIFLRQFANLISAGIPLITACEILANSQSKETLSKLILAIKYDIANGNDLSTSFRKHPDYFDHLTISMISIGEKTGKLDAVLVALAANQEHQLNFQRKIKQALHYPLMILCTALGITLCMLIFIIPKFAELFQHASDKLPAITRIIFYIGLFTQTNILYLLIVSLFVGIFIYLQRVKITNILKKHLAKLPPLNLLIHKMTLIRFARNLALSFSAGLPLDHALQLASLGHHDPEFSRSVAKLRSRIHAGSELNLAMCNLHYFPNLMIQMVKIGEESGFLDDMLNKVADFFERDLDALRLTFTQFLEPLIIIILGVLIGGLVVAMYLPIFKLGNIM